MVILPKNIIHRYRKYLSVLMLGGVASIFFKVSYTRVVGVIFIIYVLYEFIALGLGVVITPIIYERIYPSSIIELKHQDGKHYQYIAKIKNKDIYSDVFYKQPLNGVDIKVWKLYDNYIFDVRKK